VNSISRKLSLVKAAHGSYLEENYASYDTFVGDAFCSSFNVSSNTPVDKDMSAVVLDFDIKYQENPISRPCIFRSAFSHSKMIHYCMN